MDDQHKNRSEFEQKHAVLLEDFCSAMDRLMRLRDWRGVPSDLRQHWVGMQAAVIDARGLWLQSTKWPQPDRQEVLKMWNTLALVRFLMPTDGKIVLLVSAGISVRKLAKYHDCSVPEMIWAFEAAIQQIADAIAAEAAA